MKRAELKSLGYHWALVLPKACAFGRVLFFAYHENACIWKKRLGGKIKMLEE